jgi:DNA-binding SARP family transcriptional activator
MIHVHALGSAQIDVETTSFTPAAPKKFALLLRLCAEHGRRISKTVLQELIYPEQTERNGRHSIREVVYQLRKAGAEIWGDDYGIALNPAQLVADYDALSQSASLDADQVDLASSGFLPGYVPLQSEAFTEWFDGYRTGVMLDMVRALLREIARRRSTGAWLATERAARACLAVDPANEEATLALAEMLAIGGSKVQAVSLLDAFISDVGRVNADLQIPAKILRRRIGEAPTDSDHSVHRANFVGRESAMAEIRAAYVAMKSGSASCVVISGEAGIGKTRLTSEFCDLSSLEGVPVVRATLQPSDTERPMSVFVDIVPRLLTLRGSLGCSPRSMRGLQRLIALKSSSTLDDEGEFDFQESRFAVVSAIQDLLGAVTTESALILLIEDAHWMDGPSSETIGQLFAAFGKVRILGMLTTREPRGLMTTLRHVTKVSHVALGALNADATRTLTEDALNALGSRASSTTRQRIVESSGGNPLFVISLAAQCRTAGDQFSVPRSLRESLARRVDALASRTLAVLATSVALGKHATTRRLADALEMPILDLLIAVGDLVDLGLMSAKDETAMPAHPLIAEVLNDRAPAAVLRLVAGRVGQVLESETDGLASPGMLWHAGESFLRAGEDRRAFSTLLSCARHSLGMGRPGDAALILGRACSLAIPDADRCEAATELARAADLAQEPELVLRAINLIRKPDGPVHHDDLEIAEIRAMVASHHADEEVERRLVSCVTAECVSDNHRAQAALSLLKFADITGRPGLVEIATTANASIPSKQIDRLIYVEFDLIAASAAQDFDRAIKRAIELIEESERLPVSEMLRYRMNAAIALIKSGDITRSLEVLEHLYYASAGTRCEVFRLSAAVALAELHFDLYNDAAADEWLTAADRVIEDRRGTISHLANAVLRIDWAFCLNKPDEAAHLFKLADDSRVFGESATAQRWRRAIQARLKIELSAIDSAALTEAMAVAAGVAPSMSGIRDFEVACGCAALVTNGRPDRAGALVDNYVMNERRSARPISRNLREMALRGRQKHPWLR